MKKISMMLLILVMILGGCKMINKKYTAEEIMAGGVIDVEKAKASGYVSQHEMTKEMYESVEMNRNKAVQKKILANYDAYHDEMKAGLEGQLGKEVEIVTMRGIFPYDAMSVNYHLVDEPKIQSNFTYGLSDSGYFNKDTTTEITDGNFQMRIAEGIYSYAYSDELDALSQYVEQKYPQYEFNTSNEAKYGGNEFRKDAVVFYGIPHPIKREDVDKRSIALKRITELYQEKSVRTKEEWKVILKEEEFIFFNVSIHITEKSKTKIPTKEELEIIKEDIYAEGYMNVPHITGVRVVINTYWHSTDKVGSLGGVSEIYYTGEENENE
jgi:hypothetical protein